MLAAAAVSEKSHLLKLVAVVAQKSDLLKLAAAVVVVVTPFCALCYGIMEKIWKKHNN